MDANNKRTRTQAYQYLKDYLWQYSVQDVLLSMLARWISNKGVQGYSTRLLYDCFERLKTKGRVWCVSEEGCAFASSRWSIPGLTKGKTAHSPGSVADSFSDDQDVTLRDFYGQEYIVGGYDKDKDKEKSGSFTEYFSTSPPKSPLRAQKLEVHRDMDSAEVVGGDRWRPYSITHPIERDKENKSMSDAQLEEEEQLKDALLLSAVESNTALVLEEQRQMGDMLGAMNKTMCDLAHQLRARKQPTNLVIIDTGSTQFVEQFIEVGTWTRILEAAKKGESSVTILDLGDADEQIDKIIGRDAARSITRGTLRHANVCMHKFHSPPTPEARALLLRMVVAHVILNATRLLDDDSSYEPAEVYFCGSMPFLIDKDGVFVSLFGTHTRVKFTSP